MASERVWLAQADAHTSGLRSPQAPSACPACLFLFVEAIKKNKLAGVLHLRVHCHAFFDALMVFLTYDWTEAHRSSATRALRDAQSRCRLCALAGVKPKDSDFEFSMTFEAAVLAVTAALVDRQWRTDKGFGSTRGRWPVAADQLFPGGAERAVSALVRLFEAGIQAELIIGALVATHRPLAYPVIANADNRVRILRTAIARARAAEAAMLADLADLAKLGRPVIPAVRNAIADSHAKSCVPWTRMLIVFVFHPDANPGNRPDFFLGYEEELFSPLHALLNNIEAHGDAHAYVVSLASELWLGLFEEERVPSGCPTPPSYMRAVADGFKVDLSDPYRSLQFFLTQQTGRRECHGPGCGRPVHDKGAPGSFAHCAGCHVARYCSRGCQRTDWRHGPRPHKTVCALLARLFAFADMEMSRERFADACRARGFPLDDVERIIDWATDGRAAVTDEKALRLRRAFAE